MRKQKYSSDAAVPVAGRGLPAVFGDDPGHDDPHDAIDQELLGIWLSISRLRQLVRPRPAAAAGGTILRLPRRTAKKPARKNAAPKKTAPSRKPRRKAA